MPERVERFAKVAERMKGIIANIASAISALQLAQDRIAEKMSAVDCESNEWEELAFMDDELNGRVNELTDKANELAEPLFDDEFWSNEKYADILERYHFGDIPVYDMVLRQLSTHQPD